MTRPRSPLSLISFGIFAGGLAAFAAGRSWADGIPSTSALTYAGTLSTTDGAPLPGDHEIDVQLWSETAGGTMLCESGPSVTSLVGGRFAIALPDACMDVVRTFPDVFVDVLVDDQSLGRTKLGAVAYAIEAERASTVPAVASTAVQVSNDCTFVDGHVECTCPADTVAIGGGACTGAMCSGVLSRLVESKRFSADTWRVSCETETGARIECYQPNAVCLRVTP